MSAGPGDRLAPWLDRWRLAMATSLAAAGEPVPEHAMHLCVHGTLCRMLAAHMAEARGLLPRGHLAGLARQDGIQRALDALAAGQAQAAEPSRGEPSRGEPALADPSLAAPALADPVLREVIAESLALRPALAALSPEALGQLYEGFLDRQIAGAGAAAGQASVAWQRGRPARRSSGVYYTPGVVIDHVVEHTVGRLLARQTPADVAGLRIVDPACGAGAFLLRAYHYLAGWYLARYLEAGLHEDRARLCRAPDGTWQLALAERARIAGTHLCGVDIDPLAVDIARRSVLLAALGAGGHEEEAADAAALSAPLWRALEARVQWGDALLAGDFAAPAQPEGAAQAGEAGADRPMDWDLAFSDVLGGPRGGFDAVIGNPPWGQKGIARSDARRDYLRRRFPSAAGIFDLFRPFVELGVRLLSPGAGHLGMVLPDILLLKDYTATRRFLLDHLALARVDWWGMAFSGAVIDAITLTGVAGRAAPGHRVHVVVRDPAAPLDHHIPQQDFVDNDRHVFNLVLTADRRRVLAALAPCPRLGRHFEAHEGVHSGNMRRELFVPEAVDDSCRPLLFGRDELTAYALRWRGQYLRMSALARRGVEGRYANPGRPAWFERDKLLVRRTGDRVLAALDTLGRYASNNFFVIVPGPAPCALGLHGLAALLNSWFMTWYFRTVEPRKGRVFAELKIKHIAAFPLPPAVSAPGACEVLDTLGARRAALAQQRAGQELDREIDARVYALYELAPEHIALIEADRAG